MMPKVPSLTNLRAVTPPRRPSQCNAAIALEFGHYLKQEATVEGVLHVSAAQAHSCMDRFEDLQVLSAPALPDLNNVLTVATGASAIHPAAHSPAPIAALSAVNSATERTIKEAFCLATPPDTPTDERILQQPTASPARTATAAAAAGPKSSSRSSPTSSVAEPRMSTGLRRMPGRTPSTNNILARAVEESAQLELAASQHAATTHSVLNNDLARTTEAVARHRRRKLLRLLRSTQDAGQGILAAWQRSGTAEALGSLGSSFASLVSLASCDDGGDAGDDAGSINSGSDGDDDTDFSTAHISWSGCRANSATTGRNPQCSAT